MLPSKLAASVQRLRNCRYLSLINNTCIAKYSTGQHQDFKLQTDGLLYEGHRPISTIQRSVLAVGSAFAALSNPLRSDMVAALGESTGYGTLRKLQLQMLKNEVGCQILKEKPIIDSKILNVHELIQLPENTLGHTYAKFMLDLGLSSDTRPPVHYIDNTELAYIMKRYRQIHDFVHVLLGFDVTVPDEVIVKWFEFIHFGFPMTALSSLFGPLACTDEEQARIRQFVPWAVFNGLNSKLLLNVYFEHHLEDDISQFRQNLGLTPHPNL